MKLYLALLFTFFGAAAQAQQDTTSHTVPGPAAYKHHTTIATVSMGFIDPNRKKFDLPAGFEKSNTSGYAQFYGKLEYAVSNKVSIAGTVGYDAFVYNYSQLYTGYAGVVKRYKADQFRIVSIGATAFYHLGSIIHVKNLDPFVGAGLSLNNTRHSMLAQGDSTVVTVEHGVTPYLKAGARYYISRHFSVFGDVGYDNMSIFSLGFSCRFFPKKEAK